MLPYYRTSASRNNKAMDPSSGPLPGRHTQTANLYEKKEVGVLWIFALLQKIQEIWRLLHPHDSDIIIRLTIIRLVHSCTK